MFDFFQTQQGDGGVSAYLEENKVPIPFLLMMILQFALIVIDRALYLRKYILGKIIFQFVLVIAVHLWMFFVLPAITERYLNFFFFWHLNSNADLYFSDRLTCRFHLKCGTWWSVFTFSCQHTKSERDTQREF